MGHHALPLSSSFSPLDRRGKKTKRRYFSGAIFPTEGESICEDTGGIFFGSRLQRICADGSLISNRVSSQAKKGFLTCSQEFSVLYPRLIAPEINVSPPNFLQRQFFLFPR